MLITRTHPFTGKVNTRDLPVTQTQIDLWKGGMVAQQAFPNLSSGDREFIMTGITEDFEELFKSL